MKGLWLLGLATIIAGWLIDYRGPLHAYGFGLFLASALAITKEENTP